MFARRIPMVAQLKALASVRIPMVAQLKALASVRLSARISPAMSDVFILGAGFSKAISPHMPVLTELSDDVSSGLVERKSATGALKKSLFALFPSNIELWMTYLAQAHPWLAEAENLRNRATFLDMVVEINRQLSFRISRTVSESCPEWLSRLVLKWHGDQTPVLTLNYDTLIERCAADGCGQKLACSDIYPVPLTEIRQRMYLIMQGKPQNTFRLYKLHGSINWLYSGIADPKGETIYYEATRHWKIENPQEPTRMLTASDKVPFIVPPLSEKGPFFQHETVCSMWRQAGDALESADRVFILGYSLPQADLTMRYFLTDKARAGQQTFFLVNTNTDVQQHFQTLLGSPFTINGDYICGEDPIPNFVDAYVSDKL
jgi:hypothetical protein